MSKKLNILMFGPAYGHNIQPFIEFFEAHEEYELTFAFTGKNDFISSVKNVKFVVYNKNLGSLYKLSSIIKKEYDIIWYHGGYDLKLLFLIHLFKNTTTKLIINVWGEHVPQIMLTQTSKAKKFLKYYHAAYIIQCNWYGVKNLLKQRFSEDKLPVFPWGLDKAFFKKEDVQLLPATLKFIHTLDKGTTNFFYPKSFTEGSDHDCIIEAANLLKGKGVNNFCIYFWTGNVSRGDFEKNAIAKINKYDLNELIKVEKHEFLPFGDMKNIWLQMDCGLQISIHDQLSSTLLEPMYLKKEIIATKIEPYQILLDKYPGLELLLIERKHDILANRMEDFIDGNKTSELALEYRKNIIEKEFNFERNIQKMVDFYQLLLKK